MIPVLLNDKWSPRGCHCGLNLVVAQCFHGFLWRWWAAADGASLVGSLAVCEVRIGGSRGPTMLRGSRRRVPSPFDCGYCCGGDFLAWWWQLSDLFLFRVCVGDMGYIFNLSILSPLGVSFVSMGLAIIVLLGRPFLG